jgi:peptidyl-tRNA hydrolase
VSNIIGAVCYDLVLANQRSLMDLSAVLQDFNRIRIGIGSPAEANPFEVLTDMQHYRLKTLDSNRFFLWNPFTHEELQKVQATSEQIYEHCKREFDMSS